MQNFGKKLVFIFLFLYTFCQIAYPANSTIPTAQFISVSDLHFNPFFTCEETKNDCPIVDELKKSPSSAWKKIFETYDTKTPVIQQDNGYILFASTLKELKQTAALSHPRFIFVLGDFLAHDFKDTYQKYTHDQSVEGIQSFVNKTMEFLVSELSHALPSVDIFPIVGNNDTYGDHYTTQPIFYQKIAPIWSKLIKHPREKKLMQNEFSKAGYYALDIPTQKNIRLIVLNTTFFSAMAEGNEKEATEQLKWFESELKKLALHHQKALIAIHIPMGIDVYRTVKLHQVYSLWHSLFTQRFEINLKNHSKYIMGIFPGHFHTDWFQSIQSVLITSTPAISPLFGNNPGFKIFTYYPNTLVIQGFKTFFYNLDTQQWSEEYDFNKIYQPSCENCQMIDGVNLLKPEGHLADSFKFYFSLEKNAQPITKDNKWIPYYWCAIWHINENDYASCLQSKPIL